MAVFADAALRRAGQRRADPPPDPRRRRDRARARRARRLPRRARAHGAHQAPRAGGAQGRGRRLLQPDPRRLRRRARPARRGLRRHAAPARAARHGAQAVHRLGVARAAHADLLPRRLPRAARGRGARRGDAAPVPRPAARPGRAACASWPPSCSTSRGSSPARSSCGRSRPTSASLARDVAGEFTPAAAQHDAEVEMHGRRARSRSSATPSASRRWCGSCSTTRSSTRRRAPPSWFRPRARTGTCAWRSPTRASASGARPCRTSSSPSSPPPTAPAAPASASRSRASWRSRCAAS